jgi:hypothetical protein
MQTTTPSKATRAKATRAEPRPALTQGGRKATPAPKPSPSGLSREELRALVLEVIG